MATIFYGMSGEGRGHATRARTVIEALRRRHRVTVFAPDCAHALLAPLYEGTDVRVMPIPGWRFAYTGAGQVTLLGTLAAAADYRLRLGHYVRQVLPELERGKPDLVAADFEPILPRAARRLGIPFVSFDHQHYLVVNDLGWLPFSLRRQAALLAPFVAALYDWQVGTIVSSFFAPPIKAGRREQVRQVGVLIRPEVLRAASHRTKRLLVYMRRFIADETLTALLRSGRPVHVYGLGTRPSVGNLLPPCLGKGLRRGRSGGSSRRAVQRVLADRRRRALFQRQGLAQRRTAAGYRLVALLSAAVVPVPARQAAREPKQAPLGRRARRCGPLGERGRRSCPRACAEGHRLAGRNRKRAMWWRLMGTWVLATGAHPGASVRTYAHCSPGGAPHHRPGAVTLLFVNLGASATVLLPTQLGGVSSLRLSAETLNSRQVLLDGKTLMSTPNGEPPDLTPFAGSVERLSSVVLPPASITFVLAPDAGAAACL